MGSERQVGNVDCSLVATTAVNPSAGELDFLAAFRNHVGYVAQTLRRFGVGEADLEDVAHEVFLQVYLNRQRYDSSRPLRPWLFAFAFRKAWDHRRQVRRRRLEVVGGVDESADSAPSPLDLALRREALTLGYQALATIEFDQRAVFILHEIDGYAIPEVAIALEISPNTAYSRLRLARAAFDKAMRRLQRRQGDL